LDEYVRNLFSRLFGARGDAPGEPAVQPVEDTPAAAAADEPSIEPAEDTPAAPSPCDLAICAIMKDEANNVIEWIAYHRAIGVERFYLYDNGSSDDVRTLLDPLIRAGIVVFTDWPLVPGQKPAYDDFAEHHRDACRWAAFIDLDEFINYFGEGRFVDWLDAFGDVGGVALQWMIFGPSGHDARPTDLQIVSYTRRNPPGSEAFAHLKTMVRMSAYRTCWDPHCFITERPVVDEQGTELPEHYAIQPVLEHAAASIHHYFTRSREDWLIKLERGRADTKAENARRPESWFDEVAGRATHLDESIFHRVDATRQQISELRAMGCKVD
jgi:hypothetical protein